ncbi:MAG: hypothetical protein HQK76_11690 [Desulfobacterales bacterium]|nr:hypothetical protein [Desulfobacterales bacterium]
MNMLLPKHLYKFISLIILIFILNACKLSVSVVGNGAGTIISEPIGIECGNESDLCNAMFINNTVTIIKAQPMQGSRFVSWEGDCSGDTPICTLSMDKNHDVKARFESELSQDINCNTDKANAICLTPTQTSEYYIEQSKKYFYTMDSSVSPLVVPNYSTLVARWEWPPWLLLTGFGKDNMILTDILLKLHPTTYAKIDCRAFPTQPFGRCHVVFDYGGEFCPIYEEFTFNDQGEITFIEAWTDLPGWLPMDNPNDYWAEGENVKRLSTRIPGLGNTTGLIDLYAPWMEEAAKKDADIAEFLKRARQPYEEWFAELLAHSQDVANGCNPPE